MKGLQDPNVQKVKRTKLACDKGHILRFRFVLWLLCQDRAYNKVRLAWLGRSSQSLHCEFCNEKDEYIEHLFRSCRVAQKETVAASVPQMLFLSKEDHVEEDFT